MFDVEKMTIKLKNGQVVNVTFDEHELPILESTIGEINLKELPYLRIAISMFVEGGKKATDGLD